MFIMMGFRRECAIQAREKELGGGDLWRLLVQFETRESSKPRDLFSWSFVENHKFVIDVRDQLGIAVCDDESLCVGHSSTVAGDCESSRLQ
jgi:hypothetical protein